MKRFLVISVIAIICMLVIAGCNQRRKSQNAMANLKEFVMKVEDNAPEYTDEDWNRCDAEYDALVQEIDKYRYTSENSREIGRLKGKYSGIKSKYKGKELIENVENKYEELKGKVLGFKEGISGEKENIDE